jgi:MFS family permease
VSFFSTYGKVLDEPGAKRLAVSAVTTRLPTSMMSLGFLLTVQEWTRSYGEAGLVWTSFAVAFAIGVPVTGRIADRRGPWLVLTGCLICYVPTLALTLIALFAHAPLAFLLPAVAALGLCTPPAGPLIRGRWAEVVPPDRLRSAYALDATMTEAAFIGGPLIVSVVISFAAPPAVVVLGGLFMVGGSMLLATSSAKKRAPGTGSRRILHQPLGPLRVRGLRVLYFITLFDIIAYGCMIVGVTALVTHDHARSALGAVLSVYSVGVVGGGLSYGARPWPGSPRAQLSILYGGAAVIFAVTSLGLGIVLLGVLLVCGGLMGGPRDTLLQLLVGDTAPPDDRTEAFAWLSMIMWASYGLGTALGGQLASRSGGNGSDALIAAALGCGCAAACSLLVRSVPIADTEIGRP